MKRQIVLLAFAMAAALAAPAGAASASDAEIRKAIVRQSVAAYPGNCPCPYDTAANGSACGRRSAYSRPGGHAPKCYPSNVTQAEVEAYRRSRGP